MWLLSHDCGLFLIMLLSLIIFEPVSLNCFSHQKVYSNWLCNVHAWIYISVLFDVLYILCVKRYLLSLYLLRHDCGLFPMMLCFSLIIFEPVILNCFGHWFLFNCLGEIMSMHHLYNIIFVVWGRGKGLTQTSSNLIQNDKDLFLLITNSSMFLVNNKVLRLFCCPLWTSSFYSHILWTTLSYQIISSFLSKVMFARFISFCVSF